MIVKPTLSIAVDEGDCVSASVILYDSVMGLHMAGKIMTIRRNSVLAIRIFFVQPDSTKLFTISRLT